MTARGKARSRSGRAGLHFPVARLHRLLRRNGRTNRVAACASVFLAAVLEYLASEVLELAGNSARDNGKKRITPRHVLLAIRCDREIDILMTNCVLPGAGVMPLVTSSISIKNVGTIVKKDQYYRDL